MPVRIYDISKRLGLENKEVLAKAKELGIVAARVASSSLDKITAEFLELQLTGGRPVITAAPPVPSSAPQPIILVTEPTAPVADDLDKAAAVSVAGAETEVVPANEANQKVPGTPETIEPTKPSPETVKPPPPPAGPRLGDKVGFVQLPVKPAPRAEQKPGPARFSPRSVPSGKTEFTRRGDFRSVRDVGATPTAQPLPGQKQSGTQKLSGGSADALRLTAQRFIPPTTGELITLKPPIVVRELAEQLKRKPFQLIADLMELNVFANVNQAIDEVIAQKVCAKYGFRFELEKRERGSGLVHAPE